MQTDKSLWARAEQNVHEEEGFFIADLAPDYRQKWHTKDGAVEENFRILRDEREDLFFAETNKLLEAEE